MEACIRWHRRPERGRDALGSHERGPQHQVLAEVLGKMEWLRRIRVGNATGSHSHSHSQFTHDTGFEKTIGALFIVVAFLFASHVWQDAFLGPLVVVQLLSHLLAASDDDVLCAIQVFNPLRGVCLCRPFFCRNAIHLVGYDDGALSTWQTVFDRPIRFPSDA